MNIRALLFLLFVVGYIGFEIYIIKRTGYRTEPDFIFNEFVGARHASERCGNPTEDVSRRFTRNFTSVKRGARDDYVEQYPDKSAAEADAYIDRLISEGESEIDRMIDAQGCEAADVHRMVVLYERRANLNLR